MKLEFLNFMNMFDPSRVVTNKSPFDKNVHPTDDGIFSEKLFGSKNANETISYQCECGNYKGKFLEGFICEKCGKPVEFSSDSLSKLAWIDLGDFYILNPVFYYLIQKVIGTKELINCISFNKKLDKDGNFVEVETDNPYANIGLKEFKEKFDEIFTYFYETSKYKSKELIRKLIETNKDVVFINKIPLYSVTLRPYKITMKDSKPVANFDEINIAYNYIIRHINIIKSNKDFDLSCLSSLYSIQNKANIIFNKVIENISGKAGFIRSNTIGNRINFSARNVITPLPAGYGIDEVILPYLTFIELYSFHIINILSRLKKISYLEAHRILNKAQSSFNPEIYQIAKEIINKTKGKCKVLVNRNPTIAYGSILCLNIVDIKSDYSDLTMSLHNCILEPMNGDYDGDVLNIIPIFDATLKREYEEIFSPVNMFISNNNGRFNSSLSLDRDQVLGINVFNK